ncbi:1-acyl-sn-glycerol-3-phosphate acyltransferase gamma [Oopsacas minuta]|uniref:1-acyl-sn-glycerol-3-phosphate acyltransferase gamma n=1 Tax=Oopsacas minuta TaxID=111878 RepID=A0AAV7KGP0_9METZ|nr:1-acyl-sn-glycerol-3-phosphate acyltransferase gamma [Oopsacas minuta]
MLHFLKQFKIVQLYLTYILVFACISCTIGQIIAFPLKYISPRLFYVLNDKLCYCYFCLIPYAVENWGGYTIRVYGKDGIYQTFEKSRNKNMLVVMNHTGEVDWMIGWSLIERVGLLGVVKTMIKDSVKYVPVFGWSFYFSDYIFVKRSAQTDLPLIKKACDVYKKYPYNFLMTIFPEGTRFTREKHSESLAFACKRDLPQYKHHLLPRAKGLYTLVCMMKNNDNSEFFYDVEFAYRGKEATTLGILSGDAGMCDVNMRLIPLRDIPLEEKAFSEWLYQLFREKDELMEYHLKHGCFPGMHLQADQGYWRSKLALFWSLVSTLPILSLLYCLISSEQWIIVAFLIGLVPIASWMFKQLIHLTESKHGSSYGLNNKKV